MKDLIYSMVTKYCEKASVQYTQKPEYFLVQPKTAGLENSVIIVIVDEQGMDITTQYTYAIPSVKRDDILSFLCKENAKDRIGKLVLDYRTGYLAYRIHMAISSATVPSQQLLEKYLAYGINQFLEYNAVLSALVHSIGKYDINIEYKRMSKNTLQKAIQPAVPTDDQKALGMEIFKIAEKVYSKQGLKLFTAEDPDDGSMLLRTSLKAVHLDKVEAYVKILGGELFVVLEPLDGKFAISFENVDMAQRTCAAVNNNPMFGRLTVSMMGKLRYDLHMEFEDVPEEDIIEKYLFDGASAINYFAEIYKKVITHSFSVEDIIDATSK